MSPEAWVGIAISQGNLDGLNRVLGLMLHYGWKNQGMIATDKSAADDGGKA